MEITKEELERIESCCDVLSDMATKIYIEYDKELGLDVNETVADILGIILDIKED